MFIHSIAMSKIRGDAKYGFRIGATEIVLMSNDRGRLVFAVDTKENVDILGPLVDIGPDEPERT